jgi:hypothetical protein
MEAFNNMPVEKMRRMASDNEYLHKDFHIALNNGLIYLEEKFGGSAVIEYLTDFTNAYHRPLKEDLINKGLIAVKEYLEKIYKTEKSDIHITADDRKLIAEIPKCPAIEHMKLNNIKPSAYFSETTETIYRTLCKDTPYEFELLEYEPVTGRAKMSFSRRP